MELHLHRSDLETTCSSLTFWFSPFPVSHFPSPLHQTCIFCLLVTITWQFKVGISMNELISRFPYSPKPSHLPNNQVVQLYYYTLIKMAGGGK